MEKGNYQTITVGDLASSMVSNVLDLVGPKKNEKYFVYQNCTYLKIDNLSKGDSLSLTFSGERLIDTYGRLDRHNLLEEEFDIIILATGFGVEQSLDQSKTKFKINSYWRNDDRGQTSLNNSKNTYLVSGYGDGAINDILRLKIYDFNPYKLLRLLEDDYVFDDITKDKISFNDLKEMYIKSLNEDNSFFKKFQPFVKDQIKVIVHVKHELQPTNIIKEIIDNEKAFAYNRVLLFALWCCNGFTIKAAETIEDLLEEYDISPINIIIRHGSDRKKNLKTILNTFLYEKFEEKFEENLKETKNNNLIQMKKAS